MESVDAGVDAGENEHPRRRADELRDLALGVQAGGFAERDARVGRFI